VVGATFQPDLVGDGDEWNHGQRGRARRRRLMVRYVVRWSLVPPRDGEVCGSVVIGPPFTIGGRGGGRGGSSASLLFYRLRRRLCPSEVVDG
jgi:hypothetical protein